ncbi:uroporphyrinogen-III C-methyltransferase [Thalassotalea ponticola]|uniref:uroporphyrinogen-III C-methyltransferase n=1 Tax=Thalassotalea ponticola TaxID=1523392 RepID=UPI0025B60F3D|nr:uroporphyrinogen-III C-methyltransferase [Thalassotalea ponticola]MDN3653866.1 uroporphyrinogen-III C-methyltransferase [Thalassotalea ponticola]
MTEFAHIKAKYQLLPGDVALIGAGPGDAELLTIKAMRFMMQADVIVYDRLVSREIISLSPRGCQRIYVGKAVHKQCVSQDNINQTLLEKAQQGLRGVRLKGGDSFIFGRGSEEIEFLLNRGINCHVVPGITAASGATSYAGIPLTHRDIAYSCSFITGHVKHDHPLDLPWQTYVNHKQTLVFYMGIGNAELIQSKLLQHGKDKHTPVAIIYRGTQSSQTVWRCELQSLIVTVKQHAIKSPSLIVVGEVVKVLEGCVQATPELGYFSAANRRRTTTAQSASG